MDTNPLAALDPRSRFTDRAEDYARHRPGYPAEVFDAILEGLGEPSRLLAADVGAGTGIAARALAARGVRVVAVEPNAAMRAKAPPDPRIEWRDAAAETTGLPDAAFDLVVCAQSFHWFDAERAAAEFARILRSGGRLALIWNVPDASTPVAAAYRRLVLDVARGDFRGERDFAPASLGPWFRNLRLVEGRHAQRLDADGLVGRALSASYMPREGPERDRTVAALRRVHAAHADAAGAVDFVYRTKLRLAERA